VVVDGEVGYTGSLNMVERAYHRKDAIIYDEMVVRLEGPIVLQLEAVFLTDWHSETGVIIAEPRRNLEKQLVARGTTTAQVIPSGPGYEYENNLKAFNGSFYQASSRITIVNPYFVPDESLQMALTNAALRGVEVILVNSEAIDQRMVAHAQRSYYQEMLDAGVKIYLYKAPTLLHSKYILIDDDLLLVGSSNMDIRSFELNQELMLAVYDTKVVSQLETITLSYLKRSRRLTKKEWAQRSIGQRFLDSVARLTSSLQ
jgi:cardiolipin synthase